MPATRSVPPSAPFPVSGLLPKESTQALQFLKKYPDYDGRGVRVAILDTGVDVAAIGLNHKGKMVDAIDCTGSGDIALIEAAAQTSGESKAIKLLSPNTGRTLLVSSSIQNPSKRWWLGSQAAYKLWPGDLVKRRKAERRRAFVVEQSRLVNQVQERLNSLELASKGATNAEKDGDKAKSVTADDASNASTESARKTALQKEDLKAQLAVLKELADSDADPGPIIEVIVFHDGTHYRTIVGGAEGDTHDAAKGLPEDQMTLLSASTLDLTQRPALTDFRFERQHGQFGDVDMLTYSTNVLTDDTDVEQAMTAPKGKPLALSLVVTSGSHATHVAGIVGAHRLDDEAKNGVAPACELVSLKIGDTRLGSMETQQALLRAAQALIASKCDIANMSFGESGAFGVEDKGAFVSVLRDYVIRRRDILFISSAGNNGPALTTVGQPGGTTTSILSVGAYVDAGAMQQAEYALVEDGVPSSATTWCSRGPAFDGAKGVDIYAPGAAITSIPRYCLQATMMANGTSMSSPNACGGIALLLSGMKKEGIPISAARVYKAVRATGKSVDDDLGTLFIQIDKAWDYLVENRDRADQDAEFVVSITPAGKPPGNAATNVRGIYIRERPKTHGVSQYTVLVKPTFRDYGKGEDAYNLQLPVTLVATDGWIRTPDFVFLGANGRSFEVRVDASQLAPGLHSAFVEGYDSEIPGRKLFEIPVTVTKPTIPTSPSMQLQGVRLAKGKVDRRFISVPEGSTWADIRLCSSNHEVPGTAVRCWVHAVQLEQQRRLNEVELAAVLSLNEGEPVNKRIKVNGGLTIEICLAQFFTNACAFDLDVDLAFHGITASRVVSGRDELTIVGGEGIAKLECQSNLRVETFKPSVSFDRRRTFVRPSNSVIRPLNTARDLLPDGRMMNEAQLTYNFDLKEERNNITLSLPLSNHLYDSAVPLLLQLYDVNKKRRFFGDIYPKAIDKLERGSYTLVAQMLHESPATLEPLRNLTLRIDQKLSKPVESVEMYEDHIDQFGPAKPSSALRDGQIKLLPGERKILCLNTELQSDNVPKEAVPGDLLLGTLSFSAPNDKAPLRYVVPPAIKKSKSEDEDEALAGEDEPKTAELLAGLISKIPEAEKAAFLEKLTKEYPDDLGVLIARLEALKSDDKKDTDAVLQIVETILKHRDVDQKAILEHLGSKKLSNSELSRAERMQRKRTEKAKGALILALNRKCRALLTRSDGQDSPQFNETFAQYRRFSDATEKDFANVYIDWAKLHERYGMALQVARKNIKSLGAGTAQTIQDKSKAQSLERELFAKLGWTLWSAVADKQRVLDAPKVYEEF